MKWRLEQTDLEFRLDASKEDISTCKFHPGSKYLFFVQDFRLQITQQQQNLISMAAFINL